MRVSTSVLRSVKHNGGLDFSNTREAYRSKTFGELLRYYLVYKVFSYASLVENSQKVLYLSQRIVGKRFVSWLLEKTFYRQFVGGEDVRSLSSVIGRLGCSGVSPILDYAVEEDVSDQQPVVMEMRKRDATPSSLLATDPQFKPSLSHGKATKLASARTYFYQDDQRCRQNMQHFLSCVSMASQVAKSNDFNAFAAVKLTGLGRVDFLLRLSEVIAGAKKIFLELSASEGGHGIRDEGEHRLRGAYITANSLHSGLFRMGLSVSESESKALFQELDRDEHQKLSFIEWFHRFQPGTTLHTAFKTEAGSKVKSLVPSLSESELVQMSDVIGRAETLAKFAYDNGVRLMIDAEQSYFQPAISHIAVNVLMPKYNLTTPIIYNTIQCYLKDAEAMLSLDLSFAEETGFMYGVKLVRGAYMEQERALALEKGYEDPIWPCKTDTDECYKRLLDVLLRCRQQNLAQVMVASHDEQTIDFATKKYVDCSLHNVFKP